MILKKPKVALYHVHKTRLLMQKKCSMIYLILPPKAEEGWIKPDQCQVNRTWLEPIYYIETLLDLLQLPNGKNLNYLVNNGFFENLGTSD